MKSGKIEVRDYKYLAIGLILLAFAITGQSVYVTYKNSYYDSTLYRATVNKDDIEQVEILSNWPFDFRSRNDSHAFARRNPGAVVLGAAHWRDYMDGNEQYSKISHGASITG